MTTLTEDPAVSTLLDTIVDTLDIPRSYYEKAAARHKSLGDWLCRPESAVAIFRPHVSPQGSFRLGTVNRPLHKGERYDLDNVTVLTMPKDRLSQKAIKQLYGAEIEAYANAHGIIAPLEEKDRCWRLVYADEVDFHLDTLPCVPEEEAIIQALIARGVSPHLAMRAVALTDRRHPLYDQRTRMLLSSNPRGFATWFVERTRPYALRRLRQLVQAGRYASVEDVPPYEWKTPLQQSIQILKRHRDVMFSDLPELKPISMIITNLAAQSYAGEEDTWSALQTIVERMPAFVNSQRPRVPNPADPAEDYADKWAKDSRLERNFWMWHEQAKADIASLPRLTTDRNLSSVVRRAFSIDLSDERLRAIQRTSGIVAPAIVRAAPAVHISNAARPWSDRD
jgi:hypothetical protein